MERKGIDSLIEAKKVLLHMSYVRGNATSVTFDNFEQINKHPVTSFNDFVAIYEIVIFNNSKYNVDHLSIKDSFMGLLSSSLSSNYMDNINNPTSNSDAWYSGELRPYLTNVAVECGDSTIVGNSFSQIMKGKGELINKGSICPYSVCSLIVRMTGRGKLSLLDPNGQLIGEQNGDNVNGYIQAAPLYMSNSAIIKGSFSCTCGCGHKKFRPLYIKDNGFAPNVLYAPQLDVPGPIVSLQP